MSKEKTVEKKLSRAAIETLGYYCLSSTCYRAEIEEIRGVLLELIHLIY